MSKVYGSSFAIDWQNKQAVIEYCKKFGAGHVVLEMTWPETSKRPGLNYNITRVDLVETSIQRLIGLGATSGTVVYPVN